MPTARELLGRIEEHPSPDLPMTLLAARVEAVLKHCDASKVKRWGIRGVTGVVLAEDIERLLNGEEA